MTRKHTLTGAALIALIAGGAFAQDDTGLTTEPMQTDGTMATDGMGNTAAETAPVFTSVEEMTVGDVLGMVAYDPNGDRIGEIDYVVTPPSGPAAVIGIGGFIGLGEYTVALPVEEFQLSDDGTFFTLNTDKETLKAQPEFDESGVSGLPDETPMSEVMAAAGDGADESGDGGDAAADSSDDGASGDAMSEEPAADAEMSDEADGDAAQDETTTESGDTSGGDAADGAESEGSEEAIPAEEAASDEECPEGTVRPEEGADHCVPEADAETESGN
ncbi:hypothetical protein P1J78_16515 [Psychromarinibacter sp. C21-152]|uniref:PRC-barrel domain-containing protein n=1 Tax=Psychromarinibacter sediminicola TaxID=3033385 RepID=A0AAE3NTV6_9RHOB|nr:hypothetical protein [Psychromarinibacter sediminicola]MDF0602344.1 hypothetical protein [Psychromarinibacter sediminicola]